MNLGINHSCTSNQHLGLGIPTFMPKIEALLGGQRRREDGVTDKDSLPESKYRRSDWACTNMVRRGRG